MVIGKTLSSISKTEIFSKYTEAEVLATVFPGITSLPCCINSPFRVDNHPSFYLYANDDKHIYYKDFGDVNEHGSLLDLLCKYWKVSFNECLDKICKLMIKDGVEIKPKQIKTFTRKEADQLTIIQVKTRPWRDYDYEYWKSYGIEKQWLKFADIYPISHKIVTKKDSPSDKGKTYIFPAEKLAFCFVEKKEGKISIKVYQPYSTRFKWCSKMDSSIIGLWTKIPEFGDRVVICSSMKDALCLACQLHIPTLCLQGEGYNMSDTAVNELKRRYKQVFICFDTDKPGKIDSAKLAKKTGFTNIIPDLGTEKDLSDAYKKYGKQWFIEHIKPLFEEEN